MTSTNLSNPQGASNSKALLTRRINRENLARAGSNRASKAKARPNRVKDRDSSKVKVVSRVKAARLAARAVARAPLATSILQAMAHPHSMHPATRQDATPTASRKVQEDRAVARDNRVALVANKADSKLAAQAPSMARVVRAARCRLALAAQVELAQA